MWLVLDQILVQFNWYLFLVSSQSILLNWYLTLIIFWAYCKSYYQSQDLCLSFWDYRSHSCQTWREGATWFYKEQVVFVRLPRSKVKVKFQNFKINVPLHHLVNLLKTIHHCHASLTLPTIIIGDFNVDALESNEGKQLHNLLLTTFKYQQLIHTYTTDYRTALDHIYINASALIAGSGVLESYFSDHKPIWISIRHQ